MAAGMGAIGGAGTAATLPPVSTTPGTVDTMHESRDASPTRAASNATTFDRTPALSFAIRSPIGLLGTDKKDDERSDWQQFALAAMGAIGAPPVGISAGAGGSAGGAGAGGGAGGGM